MSVFSVIGHILTELFGKIGNQRQIYKQTSLAFYTSNDECLQNNVLRILTGNKRRQIKLLRLEKVRMWAVGLLVS